MGIALELMVYLELTPDAAAIIMLQQSVLPRKAAVTKTFGNPPVV